MHDLIYGRNAVYETLRAARRELYGLQVLESARPTGRISEILELASARKLKATRVPHIKLPGPEVNHQGIVLDAGAYPYADLADILENALGAPRGPFVLVLDTLQDPQNFGTLLRTAESAGVHGVVLPLARSVEVTPAVVNASAGASEHLLVARSNLAQALDLLKERDVWIVGLDQNGTLMGPAAERHLNGPLALVVGSEGEGLRDLTRKHCDVLLQLPMRGRIASLNAAVAGSVALYLAYLRRSAA